jgi:chromosome partitioning protein
MTHVMNIVAVIAQKGGTGKSTVAANLAVSASLAGLRTLAVDTDPQGSLVDWKRARGMSEPAVLSGKPSAIHPLRFAAERSGVDLMVVDTRASALDNSLEAAKAAHLTLVVVRPTAVDIRAIASTVEALKPLGRPAAFVINQAPAQRAGREPVIVGEAARMLVAYGLPIAPVALRGRAIYQAAFAVGRSPEEIDSGERAAHELDALWSYVRERLERPVAAPPAFPIRFGAYQPQALAS